MVTTATDAAAAPLPKICPAIALSVALATAVVALPPTNEPISWATYALAVAFNTSPRSPPFAATSAPSTSGSAHALPVATRATCAIVFSGLSSAASMTLLTVERTGSMILSTTKSANLKTALPTDDMASPTVSNTSPTKSTIAPITHPLIQRMHALRLISSYTLACPIPEVRGGEQLC